VFYLDAIRSATRVNPQLLSELGKTMAQSNARDLPMTHSGVIPAVPNATAKMIITTTPTPTTDLDQLRRGRKWDTSLTFPGAVFP
jgi:hypothetical protein